MSDRYIQHREPRIDEIQAANSVVARASRLRQRQLQARGMRYLKNSTTARAASATIAARSSAEDVEPIE